MELKIKQEFFLLLNFFPLAYISIYLQYIFTRSLILIQEIENVFLISAIPNSSLKNKNRARFQAGDEKSLSLSR